MNRLLVAVLLLVTIAVPLLAQKAPPSDGALTDRVRQKLVSDPEIKGSRVEVDVKQGVVTLGGRVETAKAKQKAEKLTKKVSGVKKVVNNLDVVPPGLGRQD
jgi:osmotically-inducible protein OsmY